MPNRQWLNLLGSALIIGGALLLGWYFGLRHQADEAQRQAQQRISSVVASRPADSPPAMNSPQRSLRHGDVVGELTVPRLHLSVMVFEGDDDRILKLGAGHIPRTALPAQGGNVGIAAHRDTYFRPLRFIRPNDSISLKTTRGTLRYTVTNTEIVQPSEVKVLAKAPDRDLTLVTCYPFYYVGGAPKRFIVHAQKLR
jgi:sortase A